MVVFPAILSFPPNMTVTWFMANSSDSVTARDPALSYAMLTGRRRAVSFELDQTCLKSNQLISSRWKWKDVIIHKWSLYFALRDFCCVLGDVHSVLREKDENNFVFCLKMITRDAWQFFFSLLSLRFFFVGLCFDNAVTLSFRVLSPSFLLLSPTMLLSLKLKKERERVCERIEVAYFSCLCHFCKSR